MKEQLGIAETLTISDCHSNHCHYNRRFIVRLRLINPKKAWLLQKLCLKNLNNLCSNTVCSPRLILIKTRDSNFMVLAKLLSISVLLLQVLLDLCLHDFQCIADIALVTSLISFLSR